MRPSSIAALQHRDFRLLWLGLLISFSGTTMQTAAMLWHVSMLVPAEQRGLALAFAGLVRVGPVMTFSLLCGVAADAFDRRRLLMFTQVTAALLAGVLAVLTMQGLSTVWPIYVLAGAAATVDVLDHAGRQALLPALVSRQHLANAIGLNQIVMQIASVLGPAIGGMVIASTGVGWVYAFNAVSFFFVLLALIAMRDVRPVAAAARSAVSLRAALDGLRFVFAVPIIRSTMLLELLTSFFASAMPLLPIFALDVLKVGASGYGWLYAARAVGSVVASAAMVRQADRVERRGRVLLWAMGAYSAAIVAFGLSRSFWLSFACLAAAGASHTTGMVLRAIIRQLETPDHLRGRTVGINAIVGVGGPQLGEIEAGLVAHWWSAPVSVVTGGIGSLVAILGIAATTPSLRQYRQTHQNERMEQNARLVMADVARSEDRPRSRDARADTRRAPRRRAAPRPRRTIPAD